LPTNVRFWGKADIARVVVNVRWFLPSGGHPAMLFDPLLGFSLRVEIAEVARRAVRPLHLDAPMVALPDGD